jgi:hypothetical protein
MDAREVVVLDAVADHGRGDGTVEP